MADELGLSQTLDYERLVLDPLDDVPPVVEKIDVHTQTLPEITGSGEPSGQATMPPGYTVVNGRTTRRYKGSTRPPKIWPEMWQMMSMKQKAIARREWEAEQRQALQQSAQVSGATQKESSGRWRGTCRWRGTSSQCCLKGRRFSCTTTSTTTVSFRTRGHCFSSSSRFE